MSARLIGKWMTMSGAMMLAWAGFASSQTFSSGSTGADGALAPTASTVVVLPPDGVLNYTTVTIPVGVTVTFQRNAANTPVTLLATGDVTINGTISVNGNPGVSATVTGTTAPPGGSGGAGGFNGGNGGVGGGISATQGQGPGGSAINATAAAYGAPSTFVSLIPLWGGSGGGGGNSASRGTGPGGGGGGGGIVIASSSTITVAGGGTITANGGAAGARVQVDSFSSSSCASGGSGGAVRLVASQITGTGSLQANGGTFVSCGATGGTGRTRLEAFSLAFTGSISPQASQSVVPGPVTPASNPGLANLPTLAIGTVGGVAAPATPSGSYGTADVSLPQGTTNPVSVVVTASNTPVGSPTAITLRLIPQSGNATTISIPTASHTGTFASSTATASATFPVGTVSLVQAWASMTLTGQIASLSPLIDGEPVERVMVATLDGRSSTLNLVTRSGKEMRVDRLPAADQLKVAQAWQVMKATRAE